MENLLLGVHVSISGSIDQAVDRAKALGCTSFQIFTRNPRGWGVSDLDPTIADSFIEKAEKYSLKSIVVHMPYLPNLASPDPDSFAKSVKALETEVVRCGKLNIPYLVTHLGSHLGKGVEIGIRNVVKACKEVLGSVDNDVMILLENMAGTKNSVGSLFENVRQIIDEIDVKERVGVCFDTCHAFAAGYDLRDATAVNKTLSIFDRIIGVSNIKIVHLNDSTGDISSFRDRHDHIGEGYIGIEGFRSFINDKRIRKTPMILETPIDNRRDDKENLAKIRELVS